MSQHPTTSHGSNYVAMCLAVKDQHADIREWLEHHMRLGVGKFYIYDNNSSRPMLPEFFDLVGAWLGGDAAGSVSFVL